MYRAMARSIGYRGRVISCKNWQLHIYIWNEPVQKWYIQQLHNQFWQKTTLLTKYGINANFKTATKAWLLTDTIVTHLDNFFIEQLKRITVLFNVVKLWFPDLKQCQEKEHEYVYEKGEYMSA